MGLISQAWTNLAPPGANQSADSPPRGVAESRSSGRAHRIQEFSDLELETIALAGK